jgi:hypothetical protein
LSEQRVLLSQPYNYEKGPESNEPNNARRFYAEPAGFGHIVVSRDFDYTSVEEAEADLGWMQLCCGDGDIFGGEDGSMSELLDRINDDAALAEFVNEAVERGI